MIVSDIDTNKACVFADLVAEHQNITGLDLFGIDIEAVIDDLRGFAGNGVAVLLVAVYDKAGIIKRIRSAAPVLIRCADQRDGELGDRVTGRAVALRGTDGRQGGGTGGLRRRRRIVLVRIGRAGSRGRRCGGSGRFLDLILCDNGGFRRITGAGTECYQQGNGCE